MNRRLRAVSSAVLVSLALTALGGTTFAQARPGQEGAASLQGNNRPSDDGGKVGAPEINPELLGAGAVLLVGGTLILLGRQRRRSVHA